MTLFLCCGKREAHVYRAKNEKQHQSGLSENVEATPAARLRGLHELPIRKAAARHRLKRRLFERLENCTIGASSRFAAEQAGALLTSKNHPVRRNRCELVTRAGIDIIMTPGAAGFCLSLRSFNKRRSTRIINGGAHVASTRVRRVGALFDNVNRIFGEKEMARQNSANRATKIVKAEPALIDYCLHKHIETRCLTNCSVLCFSLYQQMLKIMS